MERRVMGNYHARCGAGEKPEVVTPEAYLSLLGSIPDFSKKLATCRKYSISATIILQSIRIGKKSERYEIIISHYCIAPDCIVKGNSTRQRNCFRKFFSRKPYYWQGAGTGFEVNLSPMILGASQQIK